MTESTLPPFLTCEEMDICLKFVKFITTNPSKPPLNSSRDKLLKEFVRFMGKLPHELLLHDEKVGPYNPALILYLGILSYTEGGVTFLDMRFKDGVFVGSISLGEEQDAKEDRAEELPEARLQEAQE